MALSGVNPSPATPPAQEQARAVGEAAAARRASSPWPRHAVDLNFNRNLWALTAESASFALARPGSWP
jgi:hypothetical protein